LPSLSSAIKQDQRVSHEMSILIRPPKELLSDKHVRLSELSPHLRGEKDGKSSEKESPLPAVFGLFVL
jgi:hypothetical protein